MFHFTRVEVPGREGGTCAARCQAKRPAFCENARRVVQKQGSGSGIVNSSVARVRFMYDGRVQPHAGSGTVLRARERRERAASRANCSTRRVGVDECAQQRTRQRRRRNRSDARGDTTEATAARTVCLLAGRRLRKNPGGRLAGQAKKRFEGRLLQLSKAYAPFVETGEF